MKKSEKIKNFNPSGVGQIQNNIFGLPFNRDEAEIIIIPVPWEVTVSYKSGTAKGPSAIFEASRQIDLYDPLIKDAWKLGIYMENVSRQWVNKNNTLRKKAAKYIETLTENPLKNSGNICREINKTSMELNNWLKEKSVAYLRQNKIAGVLGGEHSAPLGLMQALAGKYSSFSILQIDAHADLRKTYEGFEYSHASIMYNALKMPQISKLVQVGIRDYCEEEIILIEKSNGRVKTFTDKVINKNKFNGRTWISICKAIIKELPENIYLSFDIDGLDPSLCPNTGTPVPGGLQFEEAMYLIELLVFSGKKIIGFDLCEVAPDNCNELDQNIGARLLYRIANLAGKSQGKIV